MNDRRPRPTGGRGRAAGFTLVETLIGLTVGMLVLAAIASILVMSARLAYKNKEIDSAAGSTRLVQEHINGELSIAISQVKPTVIRPQFSDPSSTTPTRYATMTYRVPVGSFASVSSDTDSSSKSITLDCPADIQPETGDYLMMDSPNLGTGLKITAVTDDRLAGTSGAVTLTLAKSLAEGTTGTVENAAGGKLATLQRARKYVVPAATGGSAATELRWYENAADDSHYLVLSDNVDAGARHLFAQVPEDPSSTDLAQESSVSWQFSYVSENSTVGLPGGHPDYYQTNYAEGLIMPKSGNPLNASSIVGSGSTTSTTTSTTTSSTTTSSTTSSTTTSTTTSTTSKSTTSTSSTTSKSTTSTTTSKTTTSKTTTSKTTSTSTTSKSTTSTTSTSTTSKSTTSTTSKSTTSTTSSKTTSTSTSATTSKSTTSTSSASTTSTTTSKTTTSTTTATTTSSTTSKTTTSTSTTTSKSTTTTIPFDG